MLCLATKLDATGGSASKTTLGAASALGAGEEEAGTLAAAGPAVCCEAELYGEVAALYREAMAHELAFFEGAFEQCGSGGGT
mmetsp:Transcript_5313/g.11185  ORF Transcript_5313/g.11185 Transcript_5313/m.11185 type:complete len:82 (-) Transcript_5313:399-644(-)